MVRWLNLLLDAVFPADCEACGAPLPLGDRPGLCASCRDTMRPPPEPLCVRCGVPFATSDASTTCAGCLRHPPAFATARAAALYLSADGGLNPLAAAVRALKYRQRRNLAPALGDLLAERYPFGPRALLVPVPLHRSRLRARGFNQALLLARVLGRRRGLRLAPRLLVRTRATEVQVGLVATERRRNLRAAFAVRRPVSLAGRSIVLVDDVLTTGATAHACAAVLRAAGAPRIDVYTLGRAP
jgi:ComF family protein